MIEFPQSQHRLGEFVFRSRLVANQLIFCPYCDHQLQVPERYLGRQVECPQCGSRFQAPTPVASVAGEGDYTRSLNAAARVRIPGWGLLATSLLSLLLNCFCCMGLSQVKAEPQKFEQQIQRELDKTPDLDPEERAAILEVFQAEHVVGFGSVCCIGTTIFNVIVFLGALSMLRLRYYPMALIGSFAALNPATFPVAILQLPLGIWSLLVLLNSEVRAAFR